MAGVAAVRSWSPRGESVGRCLTAQGNADQADRGRSKRISEFASNDLRQSAPIRFICVPFFSLWQAKPVRQPCRVGCAHRHTARRPFPLRWATWLTAR